MPQFEIFVRPPRGRAALPQPIITISKTYQLILNHAAYAALGEPAAVALYFDAAESILAVKPMDAQEPHACKFWKQANKRNYTVSIGALLRHYQIRPNTTRRYMARVYEGGYLGIDLTHPIAAKLSQRGKLPAMPTEDA